MPLECLIATIPTAKMTDSCQTLPLLLTGTCTSEVSDNVPIFPIAQMTSSKQYYAPGGQLSIYVHAYCKYHSVR